MRRKEIHMSAALSTTVVVEKVERIAGECGVVINLVDTRLSNRRWVNDFEVEGPAGKVEAFVLRVKDIELH